MGILVEDRRCRRCHGTGHLPQFSHIKGGMCFRCRGIGRKHTAFGRVFHWSYWIFAWLFSLFYLGPDQHSIIIFLVGPLFAWLLLKVFYFQYNEVLDRRQATDPLTKKLRPETEYRDDKQPKTR